MCIILYHFILFVCKISMQLRGEKNLFRNLGFFFISIKSSLQHIGVVKYVEKGGNYLPLINIWIV